MAYLMIAAAQFGNKEYEGSYNVGPDDADCYTTGDLVDLFCRQWQDATGKRIKWINQYDGGPHEANFLKLDCSKLRSVFGWKPVWNVEIAAKKIVEWSICYLNGQDLAACMNKQMNEFMKDRNKKNSVY